MRDPKVNQYGISVRYEIGDRVRVWPVFKRPVGTIEAVVDPNAYPIKYLVRYTYCEDNRIYVEEYSSQDLTLVDKRYSTTCNCQSVSGTHAKWCNYRVWIP